MKRNKNIVIRNSKMMGINPNLDTEYLYILTISSIILFESKKI